MWEGPEWDHLWGRGCWYCPYEAPVVRLGRDVDRAACFSCLCRVFPGWGDQEVRDWLVRQAELAAARTRDPQEQGRQLELIRRE